MGYPRDLEDYEDKELVIELAKRCAERSLGNCAYCRRPSKEPAQCGSGQHGRTAQQLRDLLKKYGVTE